MEQVFSLLPVVLTVHVIIWSLILYGSMFRDKRSARRAGRRIRERTLLWCAVVGGAPGGWTAMSLYRHKTRHWRFRVLFPVMTFVWGAILLYVWMARQ